jgi:hypothetical protein
MNKVIARDFTSDYKKHTGSVVFWAVLTVMFLAAWWGFGYNVGSLTYSTESCKAYKEKALSSPFYNDIK